MSSATHSGKLLSTDIDMLRRVLDTAGVFDLNTKWHLERRLHFGRLLMKAFQEGMTIESQLVKMALGRMEILHLSCLPEESKENLAEISRWEDEGGQPNHPPESQPHPFGKRLETDGTWTINHVLSSRPAAYGAWEMVGLTRQTAERALRTVNSHARAHESQANLSL